MNTKIRLMTRIAFGFTSPDALIALAMLSLGGHKPVLSGRFQPRKSQESPLTLQFGKYLHRLQVRGRIDRKDWNNGIW